MWKKIRVELDKLPYFGVIEVCQLSGLKEASVRQSLSRWVKQERLIRLKKNVYITRERWLRWSQLPEFELLVASLIWPKGYVSTEFVLDRFGVLSESVRMVTGVTLGNGGVRKSLVGDLVFKHLKKDLWGGFEDKLVEGVKIREANLGKALFDWFYLRRIGAWNWRSRKYRVVEDLRLNLDSFGFKDKEVFEEWVEKSKSLKMNYLLISLRRSGW